MGQGGRAAAAAARAVHTSPVTMHSPSRPPRTTPRGTSGAPSAGPAASSAAVSTASTATYSTAACPVRCPMWRMGEIGAGAKNSPPGSAAGGRPRLHERGERAAGVAGDVEQRVRVDPEEERGERAHDGHEDDLGLDEP